jgi:hypothetical protein
MKNNLLAGAGQFLTTVIARLTGLTTVKETKSSWAEVVESYAAVPEVFTGFFEAYRTGGRVFPYAVLTPTFEGFLNPTTEKMICEMDGEICVLERSGNSFRARCYPLQEIHYLETGTILLASYVKIAGVTREGVSATSVLRFNTVSDTRFAPLLEKIRRASAAAGNNIPGLESNYFDAWMDRDFKFMNFSRRSVLDGEKLIQAFLQPEIRDRVFVFLGTTFYRLVSPTWACLLTDSELILIREDEKRIAGERYGGIWQYIPLEKIAKVSILPRNANLMVFSVTLPQNDHPEYLFQTSAKREIDRLMERFNALNPN